MELNRTSEPPIWDVTVALYRRRRSARDIRQIDDEPTSPDIPTMPLRHSPELLEIFTQCADWERSADEHFRAGNYSDALTLETNALSVYLEHDSYIDQARCYQAIGYLNSLTGDYRESASAYRQAIDLKENLGDQRGVAVAWGRLAETLQLIGDHRAALKAMTRALAIFRKCGNLQDIGVVMNNMAVSYREIGKRGLVLRYYEHALELHRIHDDREGIATTLHNLGVFYSDEGAYDDADRVLQEALRLREALGNKASQVSTELRLGILHEQKQEFKQALARYENVITTSASMPDAKDIYISALCNMGGLLTGMGEPSQALAVLTRARSLLSEDIQTAAHSRIDFNLGLTLIAQGKVQEGLKALSSAEHVQRKNGDFRNLSATLSARGVVEIRAGRFPKAERLLEKALSIQLELEEHDARAHTLRLLAECNRQQGHRHAAKHYVTEADQLVKLIKVSSPHTKIDINLKPAYQHPPVVPGKLQ